MEKSYSVDLASGLRRMMIEEKYSDVIIECGQRTFHCHRVVLASVSIYFEAMFDAAFQESESGRVTMYLPEEICEQVLDFIYTGNANVDVENADSLLNAANMIQLTSLHTYCAAYLDKHLGKDNCIRVWETVSHYDMPELEAKALSIVKKFFSEICESEDFVNLREERLILDLLSAENLNCHDGSRICGSAFSWIVADFENRVDFTESILKALLGRPLALEIVRKKSEEFPQLRDSVEFNASISSPMALAPFSPNTNVKLEECVVVIGGADDGSKKCVIAFSLLQRKWFTLESLPKDPGYNFAVCAWKTYLFLSGGTTDGKLFLQYNAESNSWIERSKMPSARHHHSMAAFDNHVYVLGGRENPKSKPFDKIDVFSMTTSTWERTNHILPTPVRSCSCVVQGHTVHVIGGFNEGNKHIDRMQTFDGQYSSQDEWNTLPEDLRIQAQSLTVKNQIYSVSKQGNVYRIRKGSKASVVGHVSDQHFPRKGFGVCSIEDNIMIFGGEFGFQPTVTMLQYRPVDGTMFVMDETLPVPLGDFKFAQMSLPRGHLTEINAIK